MKLKVQLSRTGPINKRRQETRLTTENFLVDPSSTYTIHHNRVMAHYGRKVEGDECPIEGCSRAPAHGFVCCSRTHGLEFDRLKSMTAGFGCSGSRCLVCGHTHRCAGHESSPYCSRTCANAAKVVMVPPCATCGKTSRHPDYPDSPFCSRRCIRSLVPPCATCGKTSRHPDYPDSPYCSATCARAVKTPSKCLTCGRTFRYPGHEASPFCSVTCAHA